MKLSRLGEVKVKQLMTKYILMVQPEMTVLDAMERMIEKNFRCVFVVRETPYQELGIVTRFDIMAKVLGKGLNPLEVSLSEILEKKMYYIDAEKPVREAAEIMGENQICHLPVKENERVVGIISSSDIFKLYLKK